MRQNAFSRFFVIFKKVWFFSKKSLTKSLLSGIIVERQGHPPKGRTEDVERWLSWSKAHDWKSCNVSKAFWGSNPHLSARNPKPYGFGFFVFFSACFAELVDKRVLRMITFSAVTSNRPRQPAAGDRISPAEVMRTTSIFVCMYPFVLIWAKGFLFFRYSYKEVKQLDGKHSECRT